MSATDTASNQPAVQFDIGGMTCSSCASRTSKKLNRMDGVTATVNYATEKATVTFSEAVRSEDLIEQIAATGCTTD